MQFMARAAQVEGEHDPLGIVESVAAVNQWNYERVSDDEITFLVEGKWTDYTLSITWMEDIEVMHFACAFDLKIPERRKAEIRMLTSLINDRLWVGHYDLWGKEGLVMYRSSLMLAGGAKATGKQCETLIGTALDICGRYFTAFQFVVWAGKSAAEAMQAAVFETVGEA